MEENPILEDVSLVNAGPYTVVVTDDNDCMGSGLVFVVIYPTPSVNPTSTSPVCEDDPLYFFANPSGGTEPYFFDWSPGMYLNDASLRDPVIWDATFDDAGEYTVVLTDINGCSDEGTTHVIVRENIYDAGVIGGEQYFCGSGYDPDPVFNIIPATGPGPIEYFWMKKSISDATWVVIPDATGESYDPPTLYETTQYSRCARRVGCITAFESNIIEITIGTEAIAAIDGPSSACIDGLTTYSVPYQAGAILFMGFRSWSYSAIC